MQHKRLFWIAALALTAVLGLSAQASAATVKGTVVHANKRAHTLVVAGRRGRLTAVSSRHLARPGSVVTVSGRRLRNGTLRAHRLRVRGHRRHARLRGIVTWESASGFTVASRSASLLVHKSSSDDSEPVGTPVQADVTVDDHGDLDDDDVQQVGAPPAQIEVEGVVLSTDPAAETITISGDDDQEDMAEASDEDGGDDDAMRPQIVVHVPDATAFVVGDKVELIVTGPAADGSFQLVKVDEQENQAGDDDQGENQGPGHDGGNSGPGESSGDGSGEGGSDG